MIHVVKNQTMESGKLEDVIYNTKGVAIPPLSPIWIRKIC